MEYLSNREMVSLLLGQHTASRIYTGSLRKISVGEHGEEPHPILRASLELARRVLLEEMEHGIALNNPKAVRDYLRLYFIGQQHQSFVVLFLDGRNRLIKAEELFRGTLTTVSIYPREVVKAALRYNAHACIVARNCPGGDGEASRQDEWISANLKRALAIVVVEMLDYFIVTNSVSTSLRERGELCVA